VLEARIVCSEVSPSAAAGRRVASMSACSAVVAPQALAGTAGTIAGHPKRAPVKVYDSPAGEAALSAHYDEVLAALPFPTQSRFVDTRDGRAHVLVRSCGADLHACHRRGRMRPRSACMARAPRMRLASRRACAPCVPQSMPCAAVPACSPRMQLCSTTCTSEVTFMRYPRRCWWQWWRWWR
jgi:hypothetical protein